MNQRALVIALLLAVTACSTSPDEIVTTGTWGGEHAMLSIGGASATIEFDCAHGSMPAPLALTDGTFDVAGEYVQERGGPIRTDETVARQPARYSGTVAGRTMTLRVRVTTPAQDIGAYTLTLGSSGRVFKCL
jgi:hypothetical protein